MRTTVKSVMTGQVTSVGPAEPVKDVTEILVARGVSAVPVVDAGRHVVGVVSEVDVLRKEEFRDQFYREGYRPPLRTRLRHRLTGRGGPARKVRGHTAGDVMTAPAVTVHPTTTVVAAARLMDEHDVKRLPVVDDDGRLVGIVSRGDLLKVFSRPDDEIAGEVADDVLGKYMLTDTGDVRVHVDHGTIGRRSEAGVVTRVIGRVNGVVDVVDEMTWTEDDEKEWRGA